MSPRNKELNEKMRMETKTKIVDAALEVFSGYGFHGTTMNKIAKHTGLSNGLVYHYFPSKEKLFYYLVDSALKISRKAWTDAIDSPGTPLEKI
ncbi:MAG: TetR/AcrR family transcriptional regulator, partial [bacterium]|nr:TetR/AcrR family transcriptional regulator [bacterium]